MAKLAKNDFKTKYAGSYLGIVWAFIQPVITILVYWFVFSVGFRSGTGDLGVPFVLYLVAGIVPWFFFQDALIGGTNSLLEYNYLVKKVVFNISVLPVVKIISAMFVHAFFVLFTIVLYAAYGKFSDLYYLQIIYYSGCVFMLVLGLSYATSAIVIFFRGDGRTECAHSFGIRCRVHDGVRSRAGGSGAAGDHKARQGGMHRLRLLYAVPTRGGYPRDIPLLQCDVFRGEKVRPQGLPAVHGIPQESGECLAVCGLR